MLATQLEINKGRLMPFTEAGLRLHADLTLIDWVSDHGTGVCWNSFRVQRQ
jgi:hypothetical protein